MSAWLCVCLSQGKYPGRETLDQLYWDRIASTPFGRYAEPLAPSAIGTHRHVQETHQRHPYIYTPLTVLFTYIFKTYHNHHHAHLHEIFQYDLFIFFVLLTVILIVTRGRGVSSRQPNVCFLQISTYISTFLYNIPCGTSIFIFSGPMFNLIITIWIKPRPPQRPNFMARVAHSYLNITVLIFPYLEDDVIFVGTDFVYVSEHLLLMHAFVDAFSEKHCIFPCSPFY